MPLGGNQSAFFHHNKDSTGFFVFIIRLVWDAVNSSDHARYISRSFYTQCLRTVRIPPPRSTWVIAIHSLLGHEPSALLR